MPGQQSPFLDVSPGAIVLDYGASGYENLIVRPTLGTITLNIEDQVVDVYEEEFGDAPVDTVEKGSIVGLEVPFTRLDLQTLSDIYDTKTELQSADVLIFKSQVGYNYFPNARNCVIRPIINNVLSTDPSQWVLLYHVHPFNAWSLGWDRDNQRVMMVNFKIYPKQTGANIGHLFQIGV